MYKNILFVSFLLVLGFTQCTQENSKLNVRDVSKAEQLLDIETQRWKDQYALFSQKNAFNAFVMSTESFKSLAAKNAENFQFHLALDENGQLKAYAYAIIKADGVLSDAELATLVIAKPIHRAINIANSNQEDLAENAIPVEVAYTWNQNWLKQGQTWLQENPLYSFTIPTPSVHNLLRENPEGTVFHLGFEEEKAEAKLILGSAGIQKDGDGSYYDVTVPCPKECPYPPK